MRRRKQSNRDMLERHRAEYQENLDTIGRLTARNEELASIITEEENLEIIALVRSTRMGLDEFQRFLEGRRDGIPFPMTRASAEPASVMVDNDEEEMTHDE